MAARGLRNNNPGNIDYNSRNDWQGQLPPDPVIEKRFARFDTPKKWHSCIGQAADQLPGQGRHA